MRDTSKRDVTIPGYDGTLGTLHGDGTMFLRVAVGDADDGEGGGYEMTTNANASEPMVRCKTTNRTWTISWQEMIELAIHAGISTAKEKP